jgi:hypothetical protein
MFSSKKSTSIFSKAGKSTSFTVYYDNKLGKDIECEQITDLLNSTVVRDINNINTNYVSGNFSAIKNTLNQAAYNDYSIKLSSLKRPANSRYEKIRNIVNTNLQGLLQSINLYNDNVDVTAERNVYKTKADILNNVDALLEQLKLLRSSISLFPDQTITVIPVEIKAEYLVYIKTYGYPENGIWDPDLLGSILRSIVPVSSQ